MNMPQEYVTQATCTEMSLLNRKGITCVGMGAGDRKSSPNLSGAYVEVADLERSVELYRRIIERVCL
jgi:acetylornithine deacetylase/succinyl-diaminopimelate desuccinylase-like protein